MRQVKLSIAVLCGRLMIRFPGASMQMWLLSSLALRLVTNVVLLLALLCVLSSWCTLVIPCLKVRLLLLFLPQC